MTLPQWATTVTPFSKALALAIFITFPIIGFFFGMYYKTAQYEAVQDAQYHSSKNISPTITQTPLPTPTTAQVQEQETHGPIFITNFSPTSGPIGTKITLTGSGFASKDNTVYFNGPIASATITQPSADNQTIEFVVPEKDNPKCPDTVPYCPLRAPEPIAPGQYKVSVYNSSHGLSNEVFFDVTGN